METKPPETSYWFYFYWYCCFYPPEPPEPEISWDCDIDTFAEELKKLDRKKQVDSAVDELKNRGD